MGSANMNKTFIAIMDEPVTVSEENVGAIGSVVIFIREGGACVRSFSLPGLTLHSLYSRGMY